MADKLLDRLEAVTRENATLKADLAAARVREVETFGFAEARAREQTDGIQRAKAQMLQIESDLAAVPSKIDDAVTKVTLRLTQEIDSLRKELDEKDKALIRVADFTRERAELEQEIVNVRKELDRVRGEADAHVLSLERRNIKDREDYKEVMFSRIRDAKASILAQTADLLDDTSRGIVVTNEQLITELSYQSKQGERLSRTNTALLEQQVALRRQLARLSSENRELFERIRVLSSALRRERERGDKSTQARGGAIGAPGRPSDGGAVAERAVASVALAVLGDMESERCAYLALLDGTMRVLLRAAADYAGEVRSAAAPLPPIGLATTCLTAASCKQQSGAAAGFAPSFDGTTTGARRGSAVDSLVEMFLQPASPAGTVGGDVAPLMDDRRRTTPSPEQTRSSLAVTSAELRARALADGVASGAIDASPESLAGGLDSDCGGGGGPVREAHGGAGGGGEDLWPLVRQLLHGLAQHRKLIDGAVPSHSRVGLATAAQRMRGKGGADATAEPLLAEASRHRDARATVLLDSGCVTSPAVTTQQALSVGAVGAAPFNAYLHHNH